MEDQTTNNPDIGFVIGGGLEANLDVRLSVPPQDVQEGAFVVIDSNNWRFYGLVTDLRLTAIDEQYANQLNSQRFTPYLAEQLNKQTLFTNLAVMPVLMKDRGPDPASPDYRGWRLNNMEDPAPMPVKTIPNHHAPVKLADKADIADIFGEEDNKTIFRVGSTREQGHPVCLNLDKFVQRSSGIFGTTGSGKSFLARMILAGLIHADHASTLIFDMHNEYGPDTSSSDTGQPVPGLKGKFSNKVRLVGLGAGTKFGNMNADFNLEISHSDIKVEDVLQLTQILNLKETTATTLDKLENDFHENWFNEFMQMNVGGVVENEEGKTEPAPDSVAFWARQAGIHAGAAEALRSKLGRLFNRPYLIDAPASNGLQAIIDALEDGRHVVLSFGKNDSELDYLLVTNLITRKIRDAWEQSTEDYHSGRSKTEPRPLVVVVEEAHKLLNREMASQTIFSTIAREMRKYYVTLLIIDQRPSQIYDEVMSQLGTRISGSLGDENDINAVLSGLPGRGGLRGMLAKLQPKEEVLMLGWGVPMPIPIRSRRYDQNFWIDLLGDKTKPKSIKDLNRGLGMDDDSD
ncbi:MAG: ATP-binding protein [Anaerolineaceae bacterium]|jgi:hypothetical protein|nr:ATP-binding protein [Anaerolineaceae bacterium]MDD4042581.1 ATP-binding protein [Anaerolineaceae bacterium]MDD4577234.1 ATP-binding protein [Anaerolineaceae bacterium]